MTRDDGFTVMDLSTDYLNDPKWRRLHRAHPDLYPAAFVAHTATLCESWKAGRRVSIEDAWPAILPYDAAVVAALAGVGFIDRKGLVIARSWDGWFGPAHRRREAAREAGREGNARRWAKDREAIGSRSGGDPRTVPTVPTVPTRPSERIEVVSVDEQRTKGRFPPIGVVDPRR